MVLLLLLLLWHRRLKHVLSGLSIWHSVRTKLLLIRAVGHLLDSRSHGDLVGQIGSQSPVEVGGPCLQMGGQTAILHREVVIFLFVHLFIDDILLGDTKGPAGTALVYL